jgi:DNA polymerase I-like protein with 3'-5' exonuclease and polymerase domains
MHDEIIVEVREESVDEVQEIIEKCLEMAFHNIIPEMPFKLEIRIADSWGY